MGFTEGPICSFVEGMDVAMMAKPLYVDLEMFRNYHGLGSGATLDADQHQHHRHDDF